jgi:uncharacterized protein (UPF0147 family)
MSEEEINSVIETLTEVEEDTTVPRNVRLKIQNIIKDLKENTELSIKISKALNEIDEIADDVNLQSYTRTQIWNAISILEKINK